VFGTGAFYFLLQDKESLMWFFNDLVYFVIGCIPFHWIYEIFIVPFKRESQSNNFFGNLKN